MNVKTATKGYPIKQIMPHVSEIKGANAAAKAARAERRGKVVAFSKEFKVGSRQVTLTAAGHNKKLPLLLVGTASSMIQGQEHVKRWTTTDAAGAQQTHEKRTPQPEMHQLYREYMNLIDLHNRLRQAERSMSDCWKTHSWHARHFAEMLGFIEVNIFKSLQYFKRGRWAKMGHNEFRRRLAHAFMTLGKQPFPEDIIGDQGSSSHTTNSNLLTPTGSTFLPSSVNSASDLFSGPGHEHKFKHFNKVTREKHSCAYCGTLTLKFCFTCYEVGRGHIAVCGRKSGRSCLDDHAAGKAIKHANWSCHKHAQQQQVDHGADQPPNRSKRTCR